MHYWIDACSVAAKMSHEYGMFRPVSPSFPSPCVVDFAPHVGKSRHFQAGLCGGGVLFVSCVLGVCADGVGGWCRWLSRVPFITLAFDLGSVDMTPLPPPRPVSCVLVKSRNCTTR